MSVIRFCCVAVLLMTVSTAGWQSAADGLRIVVIQGEEGVNIIQQRTAVQPIVEVRDRNNLPVAGIVVTFGIAATGGGAASAAATFGSGLTKIGVVTDAAGRAVATGLEPLGNGAFSIQATATAQGQTVTATINQSNFATVAEALQAGKTPAQVAQGSQAQGSQAQSQTSQTSQTQSATQSTNAGTQTATNAASSAGSAGGAAGGGVAGGGAAAGGAAAAGGGMGALGVTGIVVGAGALAGGGYFVAKEAGLLGAKCTAQEERVLATVDPLLNCISAARTTAQLNACSGRFQTYNSALNDWCVCEGSGGLSAEDKAAVAEAYNILRSQGFNPGSLPACFR